MYLTETDDEDVIGHDSAVRWELLIITGIEDGVGDVGSWRAEFEATKKIGEGKALIAFTEAKIVLGETGRNLTLLCD